LKYFQNIEEENNDGEQFWEDFLEELLHDGGSD
jgi:hypothetical protein